MKKINYKKIFMGLIALPLIFLFVTSCFDITGVVQPASVKAGDTMTVTVNVNLSTENQNNQNYKFLWFGMLVPKSWDAKNNASVRFDSSLNISDDRPGSGTMTADTEDITFWGNKSKGLDGENSGNSYTTDMNAILPVGANYGEVEWVAFRSDSPVDVGSDETAKSPAGINGTITLTIKVGVGHSGAQLGYWVGSHQNGFKQEDAWGQSIQNAQSRHWDTAYENIVITGAGDDATDLTGPAPTYTATVAPESYMFDDIITVKFDAKEGKDGTNTALIDANEVHMNAKVMLADGTVVSGPPTPMTLSGSNIWSATMWPPGFFGVADGNVITQLHLNFSNPDGSIVVKNPGYDTDIIFITKCD
jgi:hypothetical protein